MNVGWIGLGKLGLPCALVLAQYHQVTGYDISDKPWDILDGQAVPMQEEGLPELLDTGVSITRAGDIKSLVYASDIIFVAVQTPHQPKFGGEQPMPEWETADFDYTALAQACRQVCQDAARQLKHVTLVVVSTVLPGTVNRVIRPLLNSFVKLVYSPQFIAMGTTIADFRNPEFVICGSDGDARALDQMHAVFWPVHEENRLYYCDITTAESIKVFYNTFISMKIVWANHVMELCHKTGADCDAVIDALSLATDRVVSPRYMRGGMGDGGACHPRDLIALAWMEQQLGTSSGLFGYMALARERQTTWLAEMVRHHAELIGAQVVILGRSYKPGSDLTDGSPAMLLRGYLDDLKPWQWDPHMPGVAPAMMLRADREPRLYVIATRHPEFAQLEFPSRSVVIDPFGYIPDQDQVSVIRIGRNRSLAP